MEKTYLTNNNNVEKVKNIIMLMRFPLFKEYIEELLK